MEWWDPLLDPARVYAYAPRDFCVEPGVILTNILFAASKGGLEQVAVDYAEQAVVAGFESHAVVTPDCPYADAMRKAGVVVHVLANRGPWDVLCAWRLRQLLRRIGPDLVIAHGNRALSMATILPDTQSWKLAAVAQNYKVKRFGRADFVFSSTADLRDTLVRQGLKAEQIALHPNTSRMPEVPVERYGWHEPPVIGTLGRFVHKKGFHDFLDALAILRDRGVPFQAVIGGDGDEKSALRAQCEQLGLSEHVRWVGWVEDRREFFEHIDVFCLPSLHEPFGIVVLEAMAHHLPIVSSLTEGPKEILQDGETALLFPIGDAAAMAAAFMQMLRNPKAAEQMAKNALMRMEGYYALPRAAERMKQAVERFLC